MRVTLNTWDHWAASGSLSVCSLDVASVEIRNSNAKNQTKGRTLCGAKLSPFPHFQCFNNVGSSFTCCAGACGSPPGPVAYCTGQVPGTTPPCGSTPAPTTTGTPAGTPAATTGAPAATTGAPASTTGAPAATTAAPTPSPTAFAVGGTCDAGSSLPNQVGYCCLGLHRLVREGRCANCSSSPSAWSRHGLCLLAFHTC